MLDLIIEGLCAFGLPALFSTVLVVQCASDSRPQHARSKDRTKGKKSKSGKRSHKKSSKSKSGKGRSSKSGKGKKSKSRHSSKSKSKDSKSSKTGKSQKSALPKDQSASGSSKSSKHSNSRSISTSQRELFRGSREDAADSKDMRMEPVELRWGTKGGMQRVFIRNPTNERRAIKVKCSDNNLYRVNPVYSFVEPGQVLAIDVLRQLGEPKIDKMVFVTSKASAEDERPRDLFESGEAKPMMVLPLIAVNE